MHVRHMVHRERSDSSELCVEEALTLGRDWRNKMRWHEGALSAHHIRSRKVREREVIWRLCRQLLRLNCEQLPNSCRSIHMDNYSLDTPPRPTPPFPLPHSPSLPSISPLFYSIDLFYSILFY